MSKFIVQERNSINSFLGGVLGAVGLPLQVCLPYQVFIWCKLDGQIWNTFESGNGFSELCMFACLFIVPLGAALGALVAASKRIRVAGSAVVAILSVILLLNAFSVWSEADALFVFVPISGVSLCWAVVLFLWHKGD